MLFATMSGNSESLSTSTGYVDWQRSPLTKVLVVNLSKLAEGGFDRICLITLRDDFKIVAHILHPITVPKFYTVASEVSTLELLRSSGSPVPKIYGYLPDSDNATGTKYIFMQFVRGSKLSDVWPSLGEQEVISVVRHSLNSSRL